MAKTEKLSLVVTVTTGGRNYPIVLDNTAEKNVKSRCHDLRDLQKLISFKTELNVVNAIEYFQNGCLIHIIKFLQGRGHDNVDICLFVPAIADIAASELASIVSQLQKYIQQPDLSAVTTQIETIANKEYPLREVAYPTPENNSYADNKKWAYRTYQVRCEKIFGDYLFQKHYYQYAGVLFFDDDEVAPNSSLIRISGKELVEYCTLSFNKSLLEGVNVLLEDNDCNNKVVKVTPIISEPRLVIQGKKIIATFSKPESEDITMVFTPQDVQVSIPTKPLDFSVILRTDLFQIESENRDVTDRCIIDLPDMKRAGESWRIPEEMLSAVKVKVCLKENKKIELFNKYLDLTRAKEGVIIPVELAAQKLKLSFENIYFEGKPLEFELDIHEKIQQSPLPGYEISSQDKKKITLKQTVESKISIVSILCMLGLGVLGFLAGWYFGDDNQNCEIASTAQKGTVVNTQSKDVENTTSKEITETKKPKDVNNITSSDPIVDEARKNQIETSMKKYLSEKSDPTKDDYLIAYLKSVLDFSSEGKHYITKTELQTYKNLDFYESLVNFRYSDIQSRNNAINKAANSSNNNEMKALLRLSKPATQEMKVKYLNSVFFALEDYIDDCQ